MTRQAYTLAFIFDELNRVALIRKNRPANLAGRWNGIGGKIELGEGQYVAAARELKEEADIDIKPDELRLVCIYSATDYEIRVMVGKVLSLFKAKSMTDEEVKIVKYNSLFENADGLLLDKHAMLFLQASYIALNTSSNFFAVITDKR